MTMAVVGIGGVGCLCFLLQLHVGESEFGIKEQHITGHGFKVPLQMPKELVVCNNANSNFYKDNRTVFFSF